ncbi:DUF4907 domain-containing protein [Formosa algae]|uniref:DUF4907 domain-containing protein n=1 Tax=Formosa algae TaxID=225843 RepID=A0A9X1CDC9_9FLAO|nr:DUF4907 domain-containing protein [Formosa algae]MBP1841190.1 hypothetical protein [Formosa algae]MDQ0336390.1 hypothetical protein [Formosa algae]OEI81356.1 hypothetical protein AST99_03730 [Formosa algae]PNW27898.1 hypothetical protein BKP44_10750 [Formosa algae]
MKNVLKFAFGIGLIAIIVVIFFQTNESSSSDYTTRVYPVNSGFGYEISIHNKVLIKQDNIPAIQNEIPFCNEDNANTIASLVVSKLENKIAPTISKAELKENKIILNCLN